MAKKKAISATILNGIPVAPKITLRSLVLQLLESAQTISVTEGDYTGVDSQILSLIQLQVIKSGKTEKTAKIKVPRESKRYDDQIANPSGFLNRVMQQYTVQAKRKKLGLEPVSVSAAALTIAKAANELETIGAAL
jgi:hypothetical protein